MLEIRETTREDLKLVQSLWADGNVMQYVGFPEGLKESDESLERWYRWIAESRPRQNHYSIFESGVYCGETFYQIDGETHSAALDIKLFPHARGRGIGTEALRLAIREAFRNGAERAWVDPDPRNEKALALYRRVGMVRKPTPPELYNPEYPNVLYFEITKTGE